METTPRSIIDEVVRSVCGNGVERLVRLTGGGRNETYRAELVDHVPVIVRIARQPVPWFTNEQHAMTQARGVGVPAPEVLGVEHVEYDDGLLSFSILQLIPGRPLDELASELPFSDLERLVIDSGELLARLHSIATDRGMCHELEAPDDHLSERVVQVADQVLGPAAASVVEAGVALLRREVTTRRKPTMALAHGDWLPKHFMIDESCAIVGVLDWEFTGPAAPARDLAHWEVSARDGLHDQSALLRLGYSRVSDAGAADDGWVPAFAVNFALEKLAWKNPATPVQLRHCIDVIARHVGA